jgi:predicted transcriptional regulator
MFRRIVIIRKEQEPEEDINSKLQWLSDSLGMFNDRDKESSCFRVFLELYKEKKGLRSDDIAENSRLSRGTVVFHLNKLIESGLIINEDKKYKLKKLNSLIKQLKRETLERFQKLEKLSKELENLR